MNQCLGWKSWIGVETTLAGVEFCLIIKQKQMVNSEGMAPSEQFYSLVDNCI